MAKQGAVQDEPRQVIEVRRPSFGPAMGPPRKQYLLYNRTLDKFLILLLPVTWFLYYSWRPVFSLQAPMPPQFVDVPAGASPAARAREQRLAQAYWQLSRTVIRWTYTYGTALPRELPPDFKLSDQGALSSTAPSAASHARQNARRPSPAQPDPADSRLRYWQKLQQVWLEPSVWKSQREWGTAWFTGPFVRLYVDVQDYFSHRFSAI